MSLAWSGSTVAAGLSGRLASAIWAEAPRDPPHAPAHRKRQRSEVLENRLIDLVRCDLPDKGNPAVPKISGESTRRPSPAEEDHLFRPADRLVSIVSRPGGPAGSSRLSQDQIGRASCRER